MNTTLKKIAGLSAAWLLLLTAAAFAQGSPTVSVNPTSLDFGSVEFEAGKTVPVTVKNTSQQQIRIGGNIANNPAGTFNVSIPGSNQTLNPGEQKTVNVACNPKTATTVSATAFITAGFANQTLKRVTDFAVKCTGVDPFFRFNLKMLQPTFSDFVDVQVTGDPIISQVKCAIPNDRDPFSGCDFRLRKGAQIRIQASTQNFQSFSNGSGAASICGGTAPCAFTLNANSEVSAVFKKPPAPKPTPPLTEFNVSLKKLGPGSGKVVIAPKGGPAITTDGIQNGQFAKGTFKRDTKLFLQVTPAAGSTVRSVIITGNDPNASACNGQAQCSFILSSTVFIEVGFNKK